MTNRECESCDVCCIVAEIKDAALTKKANTPCPHLDQTSQTHRCTIHETRPNICRRFSCAWLAGFGDETDRPNQNNVFAFAATLGSLPWVVVIELEENALQTTGKNIIIDLVEKYEVPIIVTKFGADPDSTGDITVIKKSLFERTEPMRGEFIAWLAEDIGVYGLVNTIGE